VQRHGSIAATRRKVLAGIAAAMGWPLVAQAQQRDGRRRICVLGAGGTADAREENAAALLQGLAARNWHEGANLHTDWRWAGADGALFERYAAELVALGPEVLLAGSNPAVEALRRQTSTIPIVFVNVNDPVGEGFVNSLARPGGNITGFTLFDPPMAGKWLGMLTQITPPVARVAVLFDPSRPVGAGPMLRSIEAAAQALTVAVGEAPVRDEAEIETTIAGLAHEERGGLLVLPSPLSNVHRDDIVALAARYRLPAVYWLRSFVTAGGLMSYGIDLADPFRRSADYVDRILKGAKPSDLPVQNPTKFELVINSKTAKALGVTVGPSLLAAADEVIE
jgi:ABC-type uncharacterized transport system substrate-binding protein